MPRKTVANKKKRAVPKPSGQTLQDDVEVMDESDNQTESTSVPTLSKRGRKKAVLNQDDSAKEPVEVMDESDNQTESTNVPTLSKRGRRKAVLNQDDSAKEPVETLEQPVENGETKIKSAARQTNKGTKRKGNKTDGNEKPSKSLKKEKDSSETKTSKKNQIPDVTSIDVSNESKTSDGHAWNFKISSWNINGIRAWLEKNGLSYLHHEKPDILCVQETKCSDDKLPEEMKKVDDYYTYWLSGDKDGYSGVGLFSKKEPISIEYGIGMPEHDNEGRVITAEYEQFYLVAAYVPNAGRGLVRLDYRMKWDKDFRDYLKNLDSKKPVILCGDLNVAHEEIDLANPKTNKRNAGFTKEEREGFSTLLGEGFVDSFRRLYPDVTKAYTFWTYMMNARAKDVGWRLDYFVISERLCEKLCDNVIRKDVFGSDHCPVTLFLSL